MPVANPLDGIPNEDITIREGRQMKTAEKLIKYTTREYWNVA